MKHKGQFLTFAAVVASALLTVPVRAQSPYRRANLISATSPYEGRCTVSVVVDGAAGVEIRGDSATLRDISGEPARWQRFECTGPLPYSAADLRIRAVEGGGRMTLTHDTYNGGVAVVRVDNFGRGDELYTFDVHWDTARPSASGSADREVTEDDAIQSCRSAVETGFEMTATATFGLDRSQRMTAERTSGWMARRRAIARAVAKSEASPAGLILTTGKFAT